LIIDYLLSIIDYRLLIDRLIDYRLIGYRLIDSLFA